MSWPHDATGYGKIWGLGVLRNSHLQLINGLGVTVLCLPVLGPEGVVPATCMFSLCLCDLLSHSTHVSLCPPDPNQHSDKGVSALRCSGSQWPAHEQRKEIGGVILTVSAVTRTTDISAFRGASRWPVFDQDTCGVFAAKTLRLQLGRESPNSFHRIHKVPEF